MASIVSDPNGYRRILFVAADGSRKTIRLSKCSKRDAETICGYVEDLVAAKVSGLSAKRATAVWVGEIGDRLHDRLARVGLVEPRESPEKMALSVFIDGYLAQRLDLKAATLTAMRQSRIWLLRYLGENRQIDKVTTTDADGYRAHMIESGLAKATIAKRCRYARHFFEVAKRRGLVAANPFAHINPDYSRLP